MYRNVRFYDIAFAGGLRLRDRCCYTERGSLDAIKAAKQKPPQPAAAAPVVDLFAELRRTATRVE